MKTKWGVLGLILWLGGCAPPGELMTEVLVKSGSSWDGSVLPAYPAGIPEITVLRITVPPGALLERHAHPVINAGFLVSGELTVVTDEGKTLRLKEGEALIEVVDKWHYGRNAGRSPAVIVVFYAGEAGGVITVKPNPREDSDAPSPPPAFSKTGGETGLRKRKNLREAAGAALEIGPVPEVAPEDTAGARDGGPDGGAGKGANRPQPNRPVM